jgi:hypothetical protein
MAVTSTNGRMKRRSYTASTTGVHVPLRAPTNRETRSRSPLCSTGASGPAGSATMARWQPSRDEPVALAIH